MAKDPIEGAFRDDTPDSNDTETNSDIVKLVAEAASSLSGLTSEIAGFREDLKGVVKSVDSLDKTTKQDVKERTRGGRSNSYAASSARYNRNRNSNSDPAKTFMDGLGETLMKSLGKSDIDKQLDRAVRNLADKLGTSAENIPYEVGKKLSESLSNTKFGKQFSDLMEKNVNNYFMGIPKGAIQAAGNAGLFGKYSKNIAGALTYTSAPTTSVVPPESSSGLTTDFGGGPGSSGGGSGAGKAVGKAASKLAGGAASAVIGGLIGSVLLPGIGTAAGAELGAAAGGAAGGAALAEGATAMATEAAAEGAIQNVATDAMANAATDIGGDMLSEAAGAVGGDMGGIGEIIDMLGPIMEILNTLNMTMTPLQAIAPLLEGLGKVMSVITRIFNKDNALDEARTQNAKKRYEEDVKTIVSIPFKILEDAANKVEQAWDSALHVINQSQGYNKAALQDLMSVYAQRLKAEGLSGVVSGADITTNLSKVLESGLSGAVAEEFAYIATILGEAIPTQDFFAYGASYASLAANAIQQGKSQAEAIALANQELEQFASNLLYSSRTLAGGFTTGLQNASSLFDTAVQIVNTSRSGSVSNVSGVLTSIAGIVGAIAPDLAPGLTNLIGSLATGGNSGSLVALRSLAGINAGNTEFLQALAKDPQGVFANMFGALAKYQTMSESNYMEVAEGLSEVFGVDMAALARVDFASLADSIRNMSINTASLDENMSLLQSGQSTLTAEQQRYQQINKYMIDEGLALVLDNEAGRAIQEHMWQEQLNNQLMEATYGVELQGAGLDLLQSLRSTLKNLVSLIFPWAGAVKAAVNLATTSVQMADQEATIAAILHAGRVGNGNATELNNLLTRGKDLPLISDLRTLYGTPGLLHNAANGTRILDSILSGGTGSGLSSMLSAGAALIDALNTPKQPTSLYKWGTISKSARSALTGRQNGSVSTPALTAEEAEEQALQGRVEAFLGSMDAAIQSQTSFNEWLGTSKKFGLDRDSLPATLSKVGQSLSNLEEAFGDKQTEQDKQKSAERQGLEEEYWKKTTLNEDSVLNQINGELVEMNDELVRVQHDLRNWATAWDNVNNRFSNYYGSNPSYSTVYGTSTMAAASMKNANALLQQYQDKLAGQLMDTPTALADVLANGLEGMDIREPTAQTNVLLAQLIKLVASIFQAVNTPGKLDIPSSLSAMALGMMNSQTE